MTPFYAGAMHYWRVAPSAWGPCLRALHDAGLTFVEAPVPWREHEPARGDFDWAVERDLVHFVELAGAAGLGVVLRLGPITGPAETCFGMPDWVLADRACLAVTSRGTPAWFPAPPRAFPIPSLASAAFAAHLRAYLAAIAERVRPLLGEPITAIAVERADFFRAGAYDLDYHPDALSGFGAEPPRAWDPANAEPCIRWVQFREACAARALASLEAMLDEVGFANVPRIELGATAKPAIARIAVGFSPWLPPPELARAMREERDDVIDRDLARALAQLAAGARGFTLELAVERDRHVGAAFDRTGRLAAPWLPPLVGALAELDWPALRRTAPIALVEPTADRRFGIATSLLDPIAPAAVELLGLSPADLGTDAGARTAQRWYVAVRRALELAAVPYALVGEHTPADELAAYRAVIAPTLDRIDRALWETLRALAEARRTVVVIGPGTPTRDEFDRPLDGHARRMGRLEPGSLDDLAGLADAVGQLALAGAGGADEPGGAGEPADAWHVERPRGTRTEVFTDAAGAVRVVFVLADASAPITATLFADPAATALRDVLTGERFAVAGGRVAVPVTGARMLRPERAPRA